MKNISSVIKNIIIGVIVLVVIVVGYNYFTAPSSTSTTDLTATGQGTETAPVGSDLISLLDQMKQISIDTSIFSRPSYVSLQDFGQTISPQPQGRNDPFAPIGVETGAPPQASSQSPNTQSLLKALQ